jgi:hypothetical protein
MLDKIPGWVQSERYVLNSYPILYALIIKPFIGKEIGDLNRMIRDMAAVIENMSRENMAIINMLKIIAITIKEKYQVIEKCLSQSFKGFGVRSDENGAEPEAKFEKGTQTMGCCREDQMRALGTSVWETLVQITLKVLITWLFHTHKIVTLWLLCESSKGLA